jgi:hypothetical protein
MGTFIDGIAASQALDTSGEVVDIRGMDITSLALSGTINFEHKSDLPAQTVGKILKAKKIYSAKDCLNARESYFWTKCELPFVYIMAELFDDYTDSAREVAGIFKYDEDHRGQHEKNVLSFSIEGAKIPGAIDGMHVKRSIARKCTVTVQPANHTAIAEKVPGTKVHNDEMETVFKAESGFEIKMLKSEEVEMILKSENLEELTKAFATNSISKPIGKTKTGKEVSSHGRISDYKGFSSSDHKDAAELHRTVGMGLSDGAGRSHHFGKANLHTQAATTAESRETRATKVSAGGGPKIKSSVNRNYGAVQDMSKALTAGTPGAPGTNVQGGALQEYKPDGSGKAVRLEKMMARIKAKKEKKQNLKKSDDSPPSSIGKTRSGKHIMSHADHPAHADFSRADHNDAAAMHSHVGEQMDKEHSNGVMGGTESHHDPLIVARYNHHYEQETAHKKLGTKSTAKTGLPKSMKAAKAGQSAAAKKSAGVEARMKKSDSAWLERAKAEYRIWPKRSIFYAFTSTKYPDMTKSEIDALGQTLALKDAIAAEKVLSTMMMKALTFGDGKPPAPVDPKNDATPKPTPKKFHDYKKAVKGIEHTEVEHVQPHYDGKSPDTIYTKAGHKLEGHEKGKFKAGDKVTVKQHMMGTHLLDHGHND